MFYSILFRVEGRGFLSSARPNFVFQNTKAKLPIFAAETCKTVGTNRKTWFESQS